MSPSSSAAAWIFIQATELIRRLDSEAVRAEEASCGREEWGERAAIEEYFRAQTKTQSPKGKPIQEEGARAVSRSRRGAQLLAWLWPGRLHWALLLQPARPAVHKARWWKGNEQEDRRRGMRRERTNRLHPYSTTGRGQERPWGAGLHYAGSFGLGDRGARRSIRATGYGLGYRSGFGRPS